MRSGLLGNVLLEQSEDWITRRNKVWGSKLTFSRKKQGTGQIANIEEGRRKNKNTKEGNNLMD